jgi:hypothetical protein
VSKSAPLYPIFEELEGAREHYVSRKREIEELIALLSMRVEAEAQYSEKLFKIYNREKHDSIKVGLLAQEVECFRADCRQRAKAAAELAENVA